MTKVVLVISSVSVASLLSRSSKSTEGRLQREEEPLSPFKTASRQMQTWNRERGEIHSSRFWIYGICKFLSTNLKHNIGPQSNGGRWQIIFELKIPLLYWNWRVGSSKETYPMAPSFLVDVCNKNEKALIQTWPKSRRYYVLLYYWINCSSIFKYMIENCGTNTPPEM